MVIIRFQSWMKPFMRVCSVDAVNLILSRTRVREYQVTLLESVRRDGCASSVMKNTTQWNQALAIAMIRWEYMNVLVFS